MRIHVIIAETGAPWDLSLEQFAAKLAVYRTDALIAVNPDSPGLNAHVSFEMTLGGQEAEGTYFTGRWQQLICSETTIEDWAPVIEWFLGLLPPASDAQIFLEAVAIPQDLPRPTTAADIARILTDLDNSV
ncbi:MAG TPA: hypothetical protein VGM10_00725 [Actinocrinis sp.]|jgi:hypothetical protein